MAHQANKMEYKNQIQKIRQPSAYCQACLGQKGQANDFMLTCGICQGSIHKSHYASQLVGKTTNQNHLAGNLQDWRCQRCRILLEKKFQIQIKCQFCPCLRGIMKKVTYQLSLTNKKQIWVHPQCTTWSFPLIWMKSKKRTLYFKQTPHQPTSKFWFRVQNQPSTKCQLCNDSYGYKIKCSFYSCTKFYHITCAKRLGVVRDLQSMRFQNSEQYCPVYCQQHLEAYVLDFANRIKIYTAKKQNQKVVHFTKVHNCYKIQLRNLMNAAKRVKQEQQIRHQLGKQMLIQNFEDSSLSLSVSDPLSNQLNSSNSDSNSSTFLTFLQDKYTIKDLPILVQNRRIQLVQQQNSSYKKKNGYQQASPAGVIPQKIVQEKEMVQQQRIISQTYPHQRQQVHKYSQKQHLQVQQRNYNPQQGQKTNQFSIRQQCLYEEKQEKHMYLQTIKQQSMINQYSRDNFQTMIRNANNQSNSKMSSSEIDQQELQNSQYENLSFSFGNLNHAKQKLNQDKQRQISNKQNRIIDEYNDGKEQEEEKYNGQQMMDLEQNNNQKQYQHPIQLRLPQNREKQKHDQNQSQYKLNQDHNYHQIKQFQAHDYIKSNNIDYRTITDQKQSNQRHSNHVTNERNKTYPNSKKQKQFSKYRISKHQQSQSASFQDQQYNPKQGNH